MEKRDKKPVEEREAAAEEEELEVGSEEEEQQEEEDESMDPLEESVHCISVQVANDHDLIKGLYKKFRAPGICDTERQELVAEMMRILDAHVAAEEEVLCPCFAREIGENVRDHALDVDASLRMLLSDLASLRVGEPGFNPKIEQLMEVFFEHMATEEHLMPELREAVGPEKLLELGDRFKETRDTLLAKSPPARVLPPPPVKA